MHGDHEHHWHAFEHVRALLGCMGFQSLSLVTMIMIITIILFILVIFLFIIYFHFHYFSSLFHFKKGGTAMLSSNFLFLFGIILIKINLTHTFQNLTKGLRLILTLLTAITLSFLPPAQSCASVCIHAVRLLCTLLTGQLYNVHFQHEFPKKWKWAYPNLE